MKSDIAFGEPKSEFTVVMLPPSLKKAVWEITEAYNLRFSSLMRDLLTDLVNTEYEKAKLILETRSKKVNQQSQLNTANTPLPENIPSVH